MGWFDTFFYNPLYNALVFIIGVIPNGDAGLAVILLTILVSLVLFSISKKAIRSQLKLKVIEPELKKIRETIPKKEDQARATIELYRKHKINPLSMILLILIQLPILFALYYVFLKGGLPSIHTELLYSFVSVPETVSMNFFGFLDISQKSIVMGIIAGVTQYIQARVASISVKKPDEKGTFQENFAYSMSLQMKYIFPVIIAVISMSFPSALPLYWATRNVFMTLQEVYVKKNIRKE